MSNVESDTQPAAPDAATGAAAHWAGTVSAWSRHLSRRIDQVCAARDLTADQWYALDVIVGRDGVAMNDLARALGMPAPTLTKCVDRLVAGALVFRLADHADRRRVLLHAAQRGVEVHRDLSPQVAAVESAYVTDVPVDDREALLRVVARFPS